MTCTQVIDLLLEADLADLKGNGDSQLAGHLRHCPACQALAAKIIHQTAALQAAVRAGTPAPIRQGRLVRGRVVRLTSLGIAAAIVGALLLRHDQPSSKPPIGEQSGRAASSNPPLDSGGRSTVTIPGAVTQLPRRPAGSARRNPAPIGQNRRDTHSTIMRARKIDIQPLAFAPVTMEPLRTAEPLDTAFAELTVDPPDGMKAAIIRTSNPNITVVWVY